MFCVYYDRAIISLDMTTMSKNSEKPKYVTQDVFERSMTSIMQSFQTMEEKFDAKLDAMMHFMATEFRAIHEEIAAIRKDNHDAKMHLLRHDRQLRNHEERIGEIEGTIN